MHDGRPHPRSRPGRARGRPAGRAGGAARTRHRRAGAADPARLRGHPRRDGRPHRHLEADAVEDRERADLLQPHHARPARRRASTCRSPRCSAAPTPRARPSSPRPARAPASWRGAPGSATTTPCSAPCAARTSGWRRTSSRSPSAARSSRSSSTRARSCSTCSRARWSTATATQLPDAPRRRPAARRRGHPRPAGSWSSCRSGSCRWSPTARCMTPD